MIKSGLIVGVVALLLAVGLSLLSPLCVPCMALFLGLGAGYLACVFDKPLDNGKSAKAGALGGGFGAIGAVVGQMIGSAINAIISGPEGAEQLARQLGLPTGEGFGSSYWVGLIGGTCCNGLLDIAFMVGLGAVGGILWWQISGKKSAAAGMPPSIGV